MKEGEAGISKDFLSVLIENYQAQIAGFYNDDKTDAERAKRNAVIEEYQDLIAIYKNKFASPATHEAGIKSKEEMYKAGSKSEILSSLISQRTKYSYENIMATEGTINDFVNIALDAMDEYADQFKADAVGFAEWMFGKIDEGYIGWTSLEPGKLWMCHSIEGRPMKTTAQLYQLYKNRDIK